MRKLNFVLFFLCSLICYSCHKKVASTNTSASKTDDKKVETLIKNVIIASDVDLTNTGDLCSVDSIAIKADILSIYINYSGGCKEHTFDLLSNGMYAKSLPVQLALCLKHNGNSDNCRELITKELKFNVSPCKYSGKNTVVLKLKDKKITYNY